MTVKFPSEKMYVAPGHVHTLDATIHEVAVGAITEYCLFCSSVGSQMTP